MNEQLFMFTISDPSLGLKQYTIQSGVTVPLKKQTAGYNLIGLFKFCKA
jgi:hypothetical protein